ncbi:hypothetical protein BBR47_15110 [Brevibacillus brevis NBRC 100599]|uniref:Uncharacterized protein n=1 Tax=Brevibacillus brevis (strain 47 / JCM 6285 / NBRC 100599) TaxID=358681 RepID=C0Z918_BREBN|nr:hypothetical protein BBR47_15110 [Brevibacillus brevis NBRC 100599]
MTVALDLDSIGKAVLTNGNSEKREMRLWQKNTG